MKALYRLVVRHLWLLACIASILNANAAMPFPSPTQEWWQQDQNKLAPPESIRSSWMIRNTAENAVATILAAKRAKSSEQRKLLVDKGRGLIEWVLSKESAEGYWWSPGQNISGDPNVNRFALGPLIDAVYESRDIPELTPYIQEWQQRVLQAAHFQHKAFHSEVSWDWGGGSFQKYPNQDVYYLLICGLAKRLGGGDEFALDELRALEGLELSLMPGGGWHYIGTENESPIYHHIVELVLSRYYVITRSPRALALLQQSVRYWGTIIGPNGYPEYIADPWWKQFWKPVPRSAMEIGAAVNGGAFFLDLLKLGSNSYMAETPMTSEYANFWRYRLNDGVEHSELGTGYVYDSNSLRYYYRHNGLISSLLLGRGLRNTFVGMSAFTSQTGGYDSILRSVTPEVTLKDGKDPLFLSQPVDDGWLIEERDQIALGISYILQPPIINGFPAPKQVQTPIAVRQIWNMKDGDLVGGVEINTLEDIEVVNVALRLSLGPCKITKPGEYIYSCGSIYIKFYQIFGQFELGPDRIQVPAMWPAWQSIRLSDNRLSHISKGSKWSATVWVGRDLKNAPKYIQLSSDNSDIKLTLAADNRSLSLVKLEGRDYLKVEGCQGKYLSAGQK